MFSEETWYCPFCDKPTIKVFVNHAHIEFRTSRGSGQSSTRACRTRQKTTILSETCSNCGKTKKEIEPRLL